MNSQRKNNQKKRYHTTILKTHKKTFSLVQTEKNEEKVMIANKVLDKKKLSKTEVFQKLGFVFKKRKNIYFSFFEIFPGREFCLSFYSSSQFYQK